MAKSAVSRRRNKRVSAAYLDDGETSSGPRKRRRNILCASCTLMFSVNGLNDLNSPGGFVHQTRDQFNTSAANGCPSCRHIFDLSSWQGSTLWAPDARLIFRNESTSGNRAAGIDVLQGNLDDAPDVLRIYPFAEASNPASNLIPRRPLRKDVQSGSVLSAAKQLIHNCMRPDAPHEGHEQCRYSRDTVLPTRVLDVGPTGSSGPSLHLQVNESETHGSYLALSYCWGKPDPNTTSKPLQLRRNSVAELTTEIKLQSLPQTIQDAIIVTRQLGFRHLWVDALCIIQDDKEDKAREISRMGMIYKNAAITLAAGVAKESSEGFLHRPGSKAPVYLPTTSIPIPMPNGETGTVYLSASPYDPDHPLDKRGWTLQEFMLSSRMLIFSDYELLWHCKEAPLQSVTGTVRGLEYHQRLESLPWAVFDECAEPHFGSLDSDKMYLWKTIVIQYSKRELTDPEDRLRAVMGITTELEKLWRDTNIYGHWKRWFVQLLPWYKPDSSRVKTRHLNRAPSWSWASVNGEIRYEEPLETIDAQIQTLAVATVVLTCRVLVADDIDPDKAGSILERPDLETPEATRELSDNCCGYILLEMTAVDDHRQKGVGLLVLKTAKDQYRRIGLVIFIDMTVWDGITPQNVILEPKTL